MPPKGKQKIMTKESPSKDSDVSGDLRKSPDDTTKLASSLSHCESGVMTQQKSPHHKNDGDVPKFRQTSDMEPKSSHKNSTGHERAQEEPSDADVDVDVSETSDTYNLSTSSKYCMMS
jgi:hypothetical protein